MRAGDCHHSQLVIVRPLWCSPALDILGIKNTRIVAKVYDPLYTEDDGYTNQFHLADIHYMHEVKAYAALSKFQASKIPKYYGSYTLSILVENQQTERQVRLILLEFIPGMSMASAKPEDYSQSTRKQIMKTIVEFETDLYTRDLVHHDMHPRNVMIRPELHSSNPEEVKVIFIDFADVEFSRIRNKSYGVKEESLLPKTYISPLLRWHCAHSRCSEFEEWIDWDWQPWLEKEFEDTAATITERMREVFLPDWLLESHYEWIRGRAKR
ncbi:hypothetical protein Plec18167_006015 [Paecilomyces lecythidis]|uniref:ABC1 atypical kinase-like domain-containing protein n=1 Tax=Paecilomyces lecythidis TaxID=3004212 RepID=A0ABR3XDU3_9EURO